MITILHSAEVKTEAEEMDLSEEPETSSGPPKFVFSGVSAPRPAGLAPATELGRALGGSGQESNKVDI